MPNLSLSIAKQSKGEKGLLHRHEDISVAQFRRDVKLAETRGNDMSKLREAILLLAAGDPLPARYKDHPLGGN